MTSKINASTTSGLVLSPDTSGEIEFQSNGTTIASITASGMNIPAGLTFDDPIAVADGGTGASTASGARTNLGLGSLATLSTVNASTITDNSVGAAELNVTGNGTTSQYLRSDADGTFTWATPPDTTANETITLSGDLSGSGTTSINAQIASNVVGANELNVSGNGTTSQFLRSDGDGTFTWAEAGGGKVLQVVQDTLVGKVSTTSSSFVDTGLSVSITPSSTSSKVLVLASMSSIGANVTAMFQLVRNTTNIAVGTGGSNNITEGITVDATGRALHAGFNYLDSPATTSATTYKVQYKQNGGGSVSINGRVSDSYIGAYSTIIAIEVGA